MVARVYVSCERAPTTKQQFARLSAQLNFSNKSRVSACPFLKVAVKRIEETISSKRRPYEHLMSEKRIFIMYWLFRQRRFQTLPPLTSHADQSGSDVDVQTQLRAFPTPGNVSRTLTQRHRERNIIDIYVYRQRTDSRWRLHLWQWTTWWLQTMAKPTSWHDHWRNSPPLPRRAKSQATPKST